MDNKIQLNHPAGKKAVRMEKEKYDILKTYILHYLKEHGTSAHTELLQAVTKSLKRDKVKFKGSIEWHLEWVKLDLEAGKIIRRAGEKTPVKFSIYETPIFKEV